MRRQLGGPERYSVDELMLELWSDKFEAFLDLGSGKARPRFEILGGRRSVPLK